MKKYVDRFPGIPAAGKLSGGNHCEGTAGDISSVAACLREYNVEDAAAALRLVAATGDGVKQVSKEFPVEPYKNKIRHGLNTEIRPVLRPDMNTKYQTLINELKETPYESQWNKSLGKCRDPVPGLPAGYDPMTEPAAGVASRHDISVKSLVNPPKGAYEVLYDCQTGHDWYRKSHSDYNPGERVQRNYRSPPFDQQKRFGQQTRYDPRGTWVRCACHWHYDEPVEFCNKIQANLLNKTRPKLGQCLSRYNLARHLQLPPNFTYGTPSRRGQYDGVEELLKDADAPVCQFKKDFRCWLASFNKLLRHIKTRGDGVLDEVLSKCLYADRDHCGRLPLEVFYAVCSCHKIDLERANFESLLRLVGVVAEDRIDYRRLVDLLDYKKSPIELMKINDLPVRNQYYVTTNQAATCDYLVINHAQAPAAGVPTIRHDLDRPIVPPGGCRAHLESLGDETSSATLLNPSVFVNYGLSFRDFFIPRQKSVIRRLFENVGYRLGDADFERLWQYGVAQDNTDGQRVCVDTFNKLLFTEFSDQRRLVVDEATC